MNKHTNVFSSTSSKVIVCALLTVAAYGIYHTIRQHQQPQDIDLTPYLQETKLTHLSIIMDGNRRWAKKQSFKPWIGHRQGVEPFKKTIELCLKHGIPYLSFYAFSLENFKRPQEEISYLFDILAKEFAEKERESLHKQGIRVRFIGDRSRFPAQLIDIITDIEQLTAKNSKLQLSLLFCYGGQQEIVAAAKQMCTDIVQKKQSPESITPELFNTYLWTGDTPPPDLIIRTGCEQPSKRLSNYYLYHCAYSELCFLKPYWPAITQNDIANAIIDFVHSKRNFGA